MYLPLDPARRRVQWLVASLLVVLASIGVPTPAVAGIGFRLEPAGGELRQPGFFELRAAAGSRTNARFVLINTGDAAASVTIYPVGGQTGATTGIVYDNAPAAGPGRWLTVAETSATQPGRSEQPIGFRLDVPDGTPAGDYVAGIAIEQRRPGRSVSQVVRAVVPVMIDVPAGGMARGSISAPELSTLPGTRESAALLTLGNAGRRICRPLMRVALTGPGESGVVVTRQLDSVLPGDSVRYALPWPRQLATGSFEIRASLQGCGPEAVITGTVPRGGTSPSAAPAPRPAASGPLPGETRYTPGPAAVNRQASPRRPAGPVQRQQRSDPAPPGVAGLAASPPTDGAGAGATLLDRLADFAEELPPILKRATPLLLLLLLAGLFLFLQEAFDRRDPKLALAPVHRESDLAFLPIEAGAAAGGPVVPLPTSTHGTSQ